MMKEIDNQQEEYRQRQKQENDDSVDGFSFSSIMHRFWYRITITTVLVILDGVNLLFFPLVIGTAVSDSLAGVSRGLWLLGGLCLFSVVVGGARRFYDTRAYGAIYRQISCELVQREYRRNSSVSMVSARANLLTEFISFLENSMPELSHQMINLVGTLIILAGLNLPVLGMCGGVALVAAVVYGVSGGRLHRLNQGQNDELERQVEVLETYDPCRVGHHFQKLMWWKIRLSDLETINFSVIFFAVSVLMVGSVMLLTADSNAKVGEVIAVIMYVFNFVEAVIAFPLFYQEMVRLREIAGRLR